MVKHLIVALLTASIGVATASGLDVALLDELELIYPDTPVSEGARSIEIDTPRGVPAGVHLLLALPDASAPLELSLVFDNEPLGPVRWYRLHDVPVEENTGLDSRTERWDGKVNPHVARRAPFRIFEAMQPIDPTLPEASGVVALRVEVEIPPDAPTGPTACALSVRRGDDEATLDLVLRVHAPVVPPIGRDTAHYTNWFSAGNVAKWHGVEAWSEPFWDVLARYVALMAHGRQNTFWVRWPDMFQADDSGRPVLNRERLERYVRTFEEAGLWWIEGAPIAGRPGGDWSTSTLQLSIVGVPATGEEGRAALTDMASQLMAVIDENGWHDRWLQHLSDEPTDTNAEDYRKLSSIMRRAMPGVPLLEATMSRSVAGAIDIWCPQVHEFQQHREFFEERKALGERVWVYTCLVPGGPWLNRLLDQERLRQVYIGWALERYGLDGFLHWGLNHYRADPHEQSVVPHGTHPNNRLPAGDSHIVYPAKSGHGGPWSGQRFEAHRIGMEDRELLRVLRRRDPARADEITASVFRAFDDYETAVPAYRAARRALLDALDH
jgi:hypothetical protein